MPDEKTRPPRDNIFRADFGPPIGLRAAGDGNGAPAGDAPPVMVGHFARFNEWTEIDSIFEGNFLERFSPGAFKKTMREARASMRVLFQHGRDPQIGDKPLGAISDLREDPEGAYYEVPLLDAPYVRDTVLPGLRENLYGASFRFRVVREEWNDDPGVSEYNPRGLPERTVREAGVSEFGPVTFPAYANATAGIRSLTDDFYIERLQASEPERLRALLERAGLTGAGTVAIRLEGPSLTVEAATAIAEAIRAATTRTDSDDDTDGGDDEPPAANPTEPDGSGDDGGTEGAAVEPPDDATDGDEEQATDDPAAANEHGEEDGDDEDQEPRSAPLVGPLRTTPKKAAPGSTPTPLRVDTRSITKRKGKL